MEKLDSDLRKLKLGSNLRKLLKKEHLSEAALARLTGIPQPMINRLAKDKNTNPKLETLQPIVDYFSITFSQLLGEEPLPFEFNENEGGLYKEVPLLAINDVINDSRPNLGVEIVPTNILVTNQAFAIKVNPEVDQKLFANNSLLIFEPNKNYAINDVVLINLGNDLKVEKLTTENIALLNTKKILAVLIESKNNY